MIRIVRLSGSLYGYDMTYCSDREIIDQVESFTLEGTPVTLVEKLEDLDTDEEVIMWC